MDRKNIINLVKSTPQYQQAMVQIQQKLANAPVTSGDVDELIKFIEAVLDHPEKYNQLLMLAIAHKKIQQGDLPPTFQPKALIPLLAVLYGLKDKLHTQGYAKGGLARFAKKGRGGDTLLAHINPREAEMLKAAGGSGTINPETGLPEYGFSWGSILSAALPAALDFIAPSVGDIFSKATGGLLGTTGSSIVGNAIMGAGANALGAALTGGDVGKSALSGGVLGAVSGGLGDWVGGGINKALGQDMSPMMQSVLGGAVVGGLGGWAQGHDVTSSALQGGIGGGISRYASQTPNIMGSSGAVAKGLQSGVTGLGHMLTAGMTPEQALMGGALKGLASGVSASFKPSTAAVDQVAKENMPWQSGDTQKAIDNALPSNVKSYTSSSSSSSDGFDLNKALTTGGLALAAGSLLGGSYTPQAVATSPALTDAQKEYLSKPSQTFDWNKIQQDAAVAGMPVGLYMSKNWNKVASGQYYVNPVAKARGGALSKIAYLAHGSGDGRADTIDARLSDGEYVIDAETVSLLGNGSNKAGAQKLNEMREQIRKQKGKQLAKGKFSPDAKSPLQYIKGVL